MNNRAVFTIEIHAEERVIDGLRKTRYTAVQSAGDEFLASESFDSAEDAVGLLALHAARKGGFVRHYF